MYAAVLDPAGCICIVQTLCMHAYMQVVSEGQQETGHRQQACQHGATAPGAGEDLPTWQCRAGLPVASVGLCHDG